ncbi:MAG: hypothetical protein IKB60_01660 [Clostridia bacterium]|nr:hypothetical protein [Clostridia bacterium]
MAKRITQCETCAYYDYDEEMDCYVCGINLDEDEVSSFYSQSTRDCGYYRFSDDYKIVKKQN